jgi:iron complex transport system ATP-binding protein
MIEAREVGVAVAGRVLVPRITVTLGKGDCAAILGRNGSGKSSLLAMLAGLTPCRSGTIWLDGQPLSQWRHRERAARLGLVAQDEPGDYWGSTADYVELGAFARGGLTGASILAGILEELDLSMHAGQPYRTLSGGERQRARIAQLFVQDPAVMLLDEPLQHLDLAHQALVMEALGRRAAAGKVVLMALHEPSLAARHCSSAVLLYDSDRVAQGPSHIMLTQENLEQLYRCRLEAAGSFTPFAAARAPSAPGGALR